MRPLSEEFKGGTVHAMSPRLHFADAHVLCYRIYDIADEIDLPQVERLLRSDTRRLRLTRENSQYLQLPNPPVTVELGRQTLQLKSGEERVEAWGRIFDHGAVSIILEVPIRPGLEMVELIPQADELYDSPAVEALSLSLIQKLQKDIMAAVEDPHLWDQNESYTVIFVRKFQETCSAADVLAHPALAPLLVGEREGAALSEREREAVTSQRFSYREDDLVLIDWNSAFVYEPSGSQDLPDLIEICNAQLLEFRFYDAELDLRLGEIYAAMQREHGRNRFNLIRSPYQGMARRVLVTLLEMSEFTERVDNSLKIIGDFYLAKVYEATVRRLRIPTWQASVTRKQQLLSETYRLLKGEVDTARSLTLEAAIVLLIITEIALAFLRH